MRFNLVLVTLLCIITWMSSVQATHGPASSCCLRLPKNIKRPPHKRIVNYTIQSEVVCPIKAIVFQTKSGKTLCFDPNNDWAKRTIRKVQHEKEITSNTAPAVATTKKVQQKKTRNGKRQQRNKCRRGSKRQTQGV
uniref:Chemokine interleukin-8-like domain-containing protein n=1 Tax=Monopterus albus TaxID=43700 RepID=A0A3Q3KP88_MONAL